MDTPICRADHGRLLYLSLLLQVGGTLFGGLSVGLLLLEHRLGDGDVIVGGDAEVQLASIYVTATALNLRSAGHFAGG